MIDTDRYVLHDNGSGIITGSPGILNGYGSVDYSTGHIKFSLNEPYTNLKVVYFRNQIAMARYNPFTPDKFFTQPQFLRYENANRSLG